MMATRGPDSVQSQCTPTIGDFFSIRTNLHSLSHGLLHLLSLTICKVAPSLLCGGLCLRTSPSTTPILRCSGVLDGVWNRQMTPHWTGILSPRITLRQPRGRMSVSFSLVSIHGHHTSTMLSPFEQVSGSIYLVRRAQITYALCCTTSVGLT